MPRSKPAIYSKTGRHGIRYYIQKMYMGKYYRLGGFSTRREAEIALADLERDLREGTNAEEGYQRWDVYQQCVSRYRVRQPKTE